MNLHLDTDTEALLDPHDADLGQDDWMLDELDAAADMAPLRSAWARGDEYAD